MSRVPILSRGPLRLSSRTCTVILGTHPQKRHPRVTGSCQPARAVLGPDAVFSAATVAVIPLYTLMVGFPRSSATRRILQSGSFHSAAAALYLVLLMAWWPAGIGQLCREALHSCSPLPDVRVLAGAFTNAHVTALAWVHLLLLDIVQAREVWLDGLKHGVATGHSTILCFMFGPLGILSHMVTKRLFPTRQNASQASSAQGLA